MKTSYRTISCDIAGKLTPNQTYTYFCLLSKSDFKTGESHVKQKTLCELAGIKKLDTLQAHLKKFYQLNILSKKTDSKNGNLGYFRVNTYFYDVPKENWIRINLNLIEKDIPSKIKGFLILLKCLAMNNSNFIGYNKTQISKYLSIDVKTVRSYLKDAESLGVIKVENKGFLILDKSFFVDNPSIPSNINDFYLSYYNVITSFCKEHGYSIPKFNKYIIGQVAITYNGTVLSERLNECCLRLAKDRSYNLEYLAKVMGVTLHEIIKPVSQPILVT